MLKVQHLLLLSGILLHLLELLETRAKDVVANPAKDGHESTEDGDAGVEVSELHGLGGGVSGLRHTHEGSGRKAADTSSETLALGVLLLHVVELVKAGLQDVERYPSQSRSKDDQENERPAVHGSQLGDFSRGGVRLLSSEGESAREGEGGSLLYRRYGKSLGMSRGLVEGRERSIERHHAKVTV